VAELSSWSVANPPDVAALEEFLSQPNESVVQAMQSLEGDLIFLGVGGKMGPTMARMARRACEWAGVKHRVIGVSRFRDPAARRRLDEAGVVTHVADLLNEDDVRALPPAAAVVSMSGFKFGVSESPELAWATNCYAPALICRRYHDARIVAFSTGNVYGLVPRSGGGSVETDPLEPVGEYAMTALGRERMYAYFSQSQPTPTLVLRLNYATELRYGVLVDLAQQVLVGEPVDLSMGYVNVIWLGDANAMTLAALQYTQSPARIVNLAGPEIISLRDICLALGARMGRTPEFCGQESEHALLNNGTAGHGLLGHPQVSTAHMLEWTADWVVRGGPLLGKPTHFQVRSGRF
jgi:nucleoside-diphosphate-sugar epimerase